MTSPMRSGRCWPRCCPRRLSGADPADTAYEAWSTGYDTAPGPAARGAMSRIATGPGGVFTPCSAPGRSAGSGSTWSVSSQPRWCPPRDPRWCGTRCHSGLDHLPGPRAERGAGRRLPDDSSGPGGHPRRTPRPGPAPPAPEAGAGRQGLLLTGQPGLAARSSHPRHDSGHG